MVKILNKLSICRFLRPFAYLAITLGFFSSSVLAQVAPGGLTQCDLDSIIQAHPAYDNCNQSSTSCSPTLSGNDNETRIWNYLRGTMSLPAVAAAALMGNWQTETAGTWDPRVNNDGHNTLTDSPISNSDAYGIAQWLGGRQTTLVNRAAKANTIPGDLALQLDFINFELTGDYKTNTLDVITRGGEVLGSQGSSPAANDAVYTVVRYYEGAVSSSGKFGVQDYDTRAAYAKVILANYGNSDVSAGASLNNCVSGPTAGCPVGTPAWGFDNGQGSEYSIAQKTQIFGDPGTQNSHPVMDANLVSVNFLGHSVQVNKLVAGCLQAVASDISAAHVNYQITDMGCYRYDSNNPPTNIGLDSYHTYGAACDINPNSNPFVSGTSCSYKGTYDMPPEYVTAFHNHGFTWGGHFCSIKDYMHFEFNGFDPNKPIPTTPVNSPSAVGDKIANSAISLAWGSGSHGNTPTPSYKQANQTYNSANAKSSDLALRYGADCGVFVSIVMHASGVDTNYPAGAKSGTMLQQNYLKSSSDYQTFQADGSTPLSSLKPGDILVVNTGNGSDANGHTLIWLGSDGGQFNAAQASWSSNFANALMPYQKTLNSLVHDFSSGSAYYLIARHK